MSNWYQSKVSSCEMSSSKVVDSGCTHDGVPEAEVQGTDQLVPRAAVDAMYQRLRQVEQFVETLIDQFDAMDVGINRVKIIDGR